MNAIKKVGLKTQLICAATATLLGVTASVQASQLFAAFGQANDQYAAVDSAGPYPVATNSLAADCRSLVGVLAKVVLLDKNVQCNESFPYGFKNPISSSVYYPENIQQLDKLPVINFVGGILSNPGEYESLVRQWASYGFVVVNSSDFINSTPTMHVLGVLEVSKLNKDPQSPLYGKVDLNKVVVAGHSAGAQATVQVSSLPQSLLSLIDPDLKQVASLPIEPGPLALGLFVNVPTLLLTGAADAVVPALTWPLLQSGTLKNAPGWFATAHNATHFSPVRVNKENEFAGISTAWVLYTAKDDATAKQYFVGPDYRLSKDSQFIQSRLLPDRVRRNALADALR